MSAHPGAATWASPPKGDDEPVLKVVQFAHENQEFVPVNGRHVKWYNCGPTVYDASHMGHARNYVTQDYLRRIMTDYFNYDVHFVMNITDIDDKIILRARHNHLLDQLKARTTALSAALVAETWDAWAAFVLGKLAKGLPAADLPAPGKERGAWPALVEKAAADAAWKAACVARDEKFDMYLGALNKTFVALQAAEAALAAGETGQAGAHALIDDAKDILAPSLDEQLKSTVTDPQIFRSLAAFWEAAFFDDMARLRVRSPDTLVRVSEYVPENVAFVEKIVQNGYAYATEDGSVWFDVEAFDGKNGHVYARIEPWSKGNEDLRAEGEGALTVKHTTKSKADFALWKASKPGEPAWPSPWGPGRPGWHLECSVMASAVLGDKLDVHSGGVDLAFPHHDNEMAQSEAHHGHGPWVNYFLHTGHLHIEGLKMSKSLKNFITIDEILQRYTARQLRLAFLLQQWNAKVDFSESTMAGEVKALESTFNNFFTNVKALLDQARTQGPKLDAQHGYEAPEKELVEAFHAAQRSFRAALCDSFNTPDALLVLRDLISRTNVYISARGAGRAHAGTVANCARWVGKMLRMLGLGEGEREEVGWGQVRREGEEGVDREEILMPYLRAMSNFRDSVRQAAIAKGDSALKDILALCDKLRDTDLVPLGVALDDQEDGKALVKLVNPEDLVRARDEKRAAAEAKSAKKAAALEAEREKRRARLEKGRTPPEEMFRARGAYASWDEKGVPLTDAEGKELSKNAAKNAKKEWEKQKKLHEEWLAWQKGAL